MFSNVFQTQKIFKQSRRSQHQWNLTWTMRKQIENLKFKNTIVLRNFCCIWTSLNILKHRKIIIIAVYMRFDNLMRKRLDWKTKIEVKKTKWCVVWCVCGAVWNGCLIWAGLIWGGAFRLPPPLGGAFTTSFEWCSSLPSFGVLALQQKEKLN